MRISELKREERLLIIEEARLLCNKDFVDYCIEEDIDIKAFVSFVDTRQGFEYWSKFAY